MPNIATWLSKFPQLIANPADIQSLTYQQLEQTLAGTADVSDPTNPVIFVFENSAVNSAGAITNYETYTRRLYGLLAQTPDDLYTQMSDVDYLNRFAIPSNATFYLLLEMDELLGALVPTGVNGIKKITIPRFTAITINETVFTMQYPIDIRQATSGGLQIVYNQDQVSPIQTLETNIVSWSVQTLYGSIGATSGPQRFVQIAIPMKQMEIQSNLIKYSKAVGIYTSFPYTDQFYYARAYSINADSTVVEMLTTHTGQVFDPTKPTLLLKDLGGSLAVELPQIYVTNRAVGDEIRVDIYTTKGDLTLALEAYAPNSYRLDLNGADAVDSAYVAPLRTFKTMSLYSNATTVGGANAMSFATLRAQVLLNNFGPVVTPITPTQLSQALSNIGYQSVIQVDNVTGRVVLATRELPVPTNGTTVAGAAMGMETLVAAFNDLTSSIAVMNNGSRITLLPDMLYQLVNGQLKTVSDSAVTALKAQGLDSLVRAINGATYLYSPFHYVLDSTADLFELRAYYLDNPIVNSIQFIEENETAGYEVGTQDKQLIRTDAGYQLRIQARSSDSWKALPDAQVFCQLAFVPEGEKTYAYLNGTLVDTVDKERVFEFQITTNYDVDNLDKLVLTSFQMYNDSIRKHAVSLTNDFEIFWITSGAAMTGVSTTQIDSDMGIQLLPVGSLGLSRERLNGTLGNALSNLWRRSRTVAGSGKYQTYVADVPLVYEHDVYERDPATGAAKFTVTNGVVTMNKIHTAGDPILDTSSNPTYAHQIGETVLDGSNKPVLVADGTLSRQMDLLMVEGVYYFATQNDAAAYRVSIPQFITNWVIGDLAGLSTKMLEKTNLFFYPKATLGDVPVLAQTGRQLSIPAGQTFNINYLLDDSAWRNTELRAPLIAAGIATIAAALQEKTVSMTTLNATLQAAVGSDAVGFDISGLGGALALTTVTVVDDSMRLSIRKQAVSEADGTLGVEDGVSVSFIQHNTNTSLSTLS